MTLASPLQAGDIHLDAPKEIVELIQPTLPDEPGTPRKMREALSETLATEGYFSPQMEFSESEGALKLKIDPGPRSLVSAVDIAVDGKIEAKTRDMLIAGWRLPVGKAFRQDDWSAAKHDILSRLLANKHAAARLLDSEAAIDPESRSARLTVHYDAGPPYRFGELQIEGLDRYSPELIARYNRDLQPGDPYSEEKLNALVAKLQATPYFTSVQANLDMDAGVEDEDGGTVTAPIRLRVNERSPHRVAFGAGFSSNTGARVEFNYHTPNLFDQAWSMNSGVRVEEKQQTAYVDVFLPPDGKNRRHSLGVMTESNDIQGLKTSRQAFGAQRIEQRGSIEQRLSINWQDETRQPDGGDETSSKALVPNIMWTWRKVDNLLDPHQGTVLQIQIGGGAKAALSDENFVRLHGRWQQFLPLGRTNLLTLRSELGYTIAPSREHIPQDYLFRTGGTGTVRGYAYQSLGVKDNAAVVGGRYMAVASGELTHWLDASWGIAGFVDAGDAIDDLKDARLALGYGIGARWRSPAGPIGVDLAYGQRTGDTHLHFSLAIPF